MKNATFSLPLELLKQLKEYTRKTGLKKSTVVFLALTKYLKERSECDEA